jgi:hypothetical protein
MMANKFYFVVMKIVLFLICPIFLSAQVKLKTKIAQEKTVYDSTFTLSTREEYNQAGKLLVFEEPRLYCTQIFEYDNNGKLIKEDIMCGESDGNGIYYYDHSEKNKITITAELGAFVNFRIEELYDANNNKIMAKKWKNRLDEDSTYSVESFVYTPQNKIKSREEKASYFSRQGKAWEKVNDTHTQTLYDYTPFDSLQNVTFWDLLTQKKRILEAYNYDNNMQLKEVIYNYESGESRKVYSYDKAKQISNIRMESRASYKQTWQIDSQTQFVYKKTQLMQEITQSYEGRLLRSKIVNKYQNSLLVSTTEYDRKGKIVSEMLYEYSYFPN